MTNLEAINYPEPGAFLERVRHGLEQQEAANSLMLGILFHATREPRAAAQGIINVVVEDGEGWSIAAIMMPSRPLLLSAATHPSDRAIEALTEHLQAMDLPITAVVAPVSLARAFAEAWSQRVGCNVEVRFQQRIHRLTEVRLPVNHSGLLRIATDGDIERVAQWFLEFDIEALNEHDADRARERAIKRVSAGVVYLWDDGEARAMAVRVRTTTHTASIGGVYTPPHWRGNGHATAAVAQLSRELLNEGYAMCVLYTDLANPVSNSIYRRIGYEPVVDSDHIVFTQPR
ncbi:MAG: hypothetical protein RLZZ385_1435 [Pseudomonadota bacterium]|jgi:predicted GNAT family acetyltransferase